MVKNTLLDDMDGTGGSSGDPAGVPFLDPNKPASPAQPPKLKFVHPSTVEIPSVTVRDLSVVPPAEIDGLANDLERTGSTMMTAVRCREMADGRIVAVSGVLRTLAARRLVDRGVEFPLKVEIFEMTDAEEAALALRDSEPSLKIPGIDKARYLQAYMDAKGFNQKQAARALKIDEGTVCRTLSVPEVRALLGDKVASVRDLTPDAAAKVMAKHRNPETRDKLEAVIDGLGKNGTIKDAVRTINAAFAPPEAGGVDVVGDDDAILGRCKVESKKGDIVIRLVPEAGSVERPDLARFILDALDRLAR